MGQKCNIRESLCDTDAVLASLCSLALIADQYGMANELERPMTETCAYDKAALF